MHFLLRVLGVRAVLKAEILRVLGVWWAVQNPGYKQYPQYKHPKWLEHSEYQECWARKYCEYSQHIRPKYCQYSKYSSSPPESDLLQVPLAVPAVNAVYNKMRLKLFKRYTDGRSILHTLEYTAHIESTRSTKGWSTASTWRYPQYRSFEILEVQQYSTSSSSEPRNTTSMTVSAVHNLEINTVGTKVLKSTSSSIYFESILRVVYAFPGSIYSGYSQYCKDSGCLYGGCYLCTRGSICCPPYSQHSQNLGLQCCSYSQYSQNWGHHIWLIEYCNTLSTNSIQSIEPQNTASTGSIRNIKHHTNILYHAASCTDTPTYSSSNSIWSPAVLLLVVWN